MQLSSNIKYPVGNLRLDDKKITERLILNPLHNPEVTHKNILARQYIIETEKKIEQNLVEALKLRDDKAFSMLYNNYTAAILGIIMQTVKNMEAAEDVHQETFIKIYKYIAEYNPDKGRLFTWMAKIAKNTAIDKQRSKGERNTKKNDSMDDHIGIVDDLFQEIFNVETIGIKQLTTVLPAHLKRIIDMVYFAGYTQSETAKELNLPIGTVKTQVRSAILTLRKCIEKDQL